MQGCAHYLCTTAPERGLPRRSDSHLYADQAAGEDDVSGVVVEAQCRDGQPGLHSGPKFNLAALNNHRFSTTQRADRSSGHFRRGMPR